MDSFWDKTLTRERKFKDYSTMEDCITKITINYDTLRQIIVDEKKIDETRHFKRVFKTEEDFSRFTEPTEKEKEEIEHWLENSDYYYIGLIEEYETVVETFHNNYILDNYSSAWPSSDEQNELLEREAMILSELWEDSGYRALKFDKRMYKLYDFLYNINNIPFIYQQALEKIKKNINYAIQDKTTKLGLIHERFKAREVIKYYLIKAMWDTRNKLGRTYFDIRLKRDGLEHIIVED